MRKMEQSPSTGGHGFDSRRGFRFFLCPTLVTTENSIFLLQRDYSNPCPLNCRCAPLPTGLSTVDTCFHFQLASLRFGSRSYYFFNVRSRGNACYQADHSGLYLVAISCLWLLCLSHYFDYLQP